MASPYGERKLVFVIPFTGAEGAGVKYGFLTNEIRTVLGHTAVTGAYPTGLVIGANAPKPGRAKLERATGVESTFYAASARAAAIAAGWKLSPGRVRNGASSAKSKTVHILHEDNKIAWRMPSYLYNRLSAADRTGLGIVDSASTDLDLVFGVRYPVLPRVAKIASSTQGTGQTAVTISSRLTTFCDPSRLDNLPEGWVTVKASTNRL